MTNIWVNGDMSAGMTGFDGFLNTVDTWTPADDIYVNQPLSNLRLIDGAAHFTGFYDPSGPGSYAYRLAPPAPHLLRGLYLEAGTYRLGFDFGSTSSGMNGLQRFEVELDGVQIAALPVWGPDSSGHFGGIAPGPVVLSVSIAAAGWHSFGFGFDSPGFNLDTSPYWQYANRAVIDNLALSTGDARSGTEADDRLTGTAAADLLWGLGGSDRIDGRAGADRMAGGDGNDSYLLRDAGDRVIETAHHGRDTIRALVSCDLTGLGAASGAGPAPCDVERVVLLGGADLDVVGNGLRNTIVANAGLNRIDGGGGWIRCPSPVPRRA